MIKTGKENRGGTGSMKPKLDKYVSSSLAKYEKAAKGST